MWMLDDLLSQDLGDPAGKNILVDIMNESVFSRGIKLTTVVNLIPLFLRKQW